MKEALKQRLAVTAGAAAAAFAPAAVQGAIIYNNTSPITATFNSPNNSHNWDVDGDGTTDFRLEGERYFTTNAQPVTTYGGTALQWAAAADARVMLNSDGAAGRGLVWKGMAAADDFGRLAAGFAVGPTLATGYDFSPNGRSGRRVVGGFASGASMTFQPTPASFYALLYAGIAGNFQDGAFGNNYIGFSFAIAGASHYGWAQLFVADGTGTGGRGDVTISRWAYESTAGCGLEVGQTSGDNCPANQVPTPGTLLLLAAGAAGLRRWRGTAPAA